MKICCMINYVIYIIIRSRKIKVILKYMINICKKINFYYSICYRLNIINDINIENDILYSKKRIGYSCYVFEKSYVK